MKKILSILISVVLSFFASFIFLQANTTASRSSEYHNFLLKTNADLIVFYNNESSFDDDFYYMNRIYSAYYKNDKLPLDILMIKNEVNYTFFNNLSLNENKNSNNKEDRLDNMIRKINPYVMKSIIYFSLIFISSMVIVLLLQKINKLTRPPSQLMLTRWCDRRILTTTAIDQAFTSTGFSLAIRASSSLPNKLSMPRVSYMLLNSACEKSPLAAM